MEDAKREMQRKHRQAGPAWDEHHRPAEATDGGIGAVIDQVDAETQGSAKSKHPGTDKLIDLIADAKKKASKAAERKATHQATHAPSSEEWHQLVLEARTITGCKGLEIAENAPNSVKDLSMIAKFRDRKWPAEKNTDIFVAVQIHTELPTEDTPEFRTRWNAAMYIPGLPSGKTWDGVWRLQSQKELRAHAGDNEVWKVHDKIERSADALARRAIFNLVKNATAHRYAEVKRANRRAKEGQAQPESAAAAAPPTAMKAAPYPIPLPRIAELRRYIEAFGGASDAGLAARAEIQRYRSSMGRAELPAVVALDQHVSAVEKALNPENRRVFFEIIGKAPLDPDDQALVEPLVKKIQSILGSRVFPEPPEAISLDR